MRNFGLDITEELAAEIKKIVFFIELQASTTLRYTDCDIDLYYDGDKFQHFDLSIGSVNFTADMAVDRMQINFANPGLAFSSVLLGEDVLNKPVLVSLACLDADNQIITAPIEVFRGTVTTWNLTETRAVLNVANEFALWRKKTLRQSQSSCPWPFKDDECGYTGAEAWCDQSYDRCAELSNTDNFGGFRFLPDIIEKEIWWGRLPK